jgi:hypothetical protein
MLFGPLLAGGRREPAAVGPPRVTEALRQTPPIAPRKPTSSPAPGDRKALRTSTGPPGRSRGGVHKLSTGALLAPAPEATLTHLRPVRRRWLDLLSPIGRLGIRGAARGDGDYLFAPLGGASDRLSFDTPPTALTTCRDQAPVFPFARTCLSSASTARSSSW